MRRIRVIPTLLLKGSGIVKTIKFDKPKYIGDPINAVKIFNDKEVDEIVILDIQSTKENKEPNYDLIYSLASECFMPMAYGGGIKNYNQAKKILQSGVEKIIINTAAYGNLDLITQLSEEFGSQSIIVSIDVKRTILGKQRVFVKSGTVNTKQSPQEYAHKSEQAGAGEIILNSIDRDGTRIGYDLELIKHVSNSISIPLVACGGANEVLDFTRAIRSGASAVSAGSLFVYKGDVNSILINYPTQKKLTQEVFNHI